MEITLEKSMKQICSPFVVYNSEHDKHFLIGEFYGVNDAYEIYAFKVMHLPYGDSLKKISEVEPSFDYLYNTFQIMIDNHHKTIKFGPTGNILLSENRGMGLGSFCMSKLIERIKKSYSGYRIHNGSLSFVDAADELSWKIRDTFYSHLGFTVSVDEKGSGKFSSTVDSLKTNYGKLTEISTLALLSQIYEQRKELARHGRAIEIYESRSLRDSRELRARAVTIRKMWAWGGLVALVIIIIAWLMITY